MATSLALRFRSNLIRTATLLHPSSLRPPPPPLPKPSQSLFSSLSITSPIISHESPSWFSLSSHRFLSTSRRPSSRPKKTVDPIAARARQLQTKRLWTYALTFATLSGFVVIILNTFNDKLAFYVMPTDAIEEIKNNPTGKFFRLGGLVLEGSVVYPSSRDVEFVMTDLITDIVVRYEGPLPDMFREGHSIVTLGFVKPFTDEIKNIDTSGRINNVSAKARSGEYYFLATEVLAKHDEKYMPKEVAAAIEKNKKIIAESNEEKAADGEKQGENIFFICKRKTGRWGEGYWRLEI
ncbi:cytochrome c-type biogenesis protein CcmE homolog, mitochondrial isoform X1 [Trifolium pratense]|uniref:cytochrome c-type biogenesis protein CcmE homolog, mitochondrial isoform X1 n=1 Tax=Trifolium pratense TaxID=57577 RepID=UPI001E691A51|nr:cytochrome c-type biogenesis protein CcmE homolog, mitochondrial isoform X1 [Trifolium pratense]